MKRLLNTHTANDPLKFLFDVDEAAAILRISERHLHAIKCKELDPRKSKLIRYITIGDRVLFPREEIERYIKYEMRRQWGE